jgi:hypothetical protein
MGKKETLPIEKGFVLRVFFILFGDNNNEAIIIMHTVWRGTISFELVTIPVRLHAATEVGRVVAK